MNKTYMVVELSAGADADKYPVRYSAEGPDVTKDECRTTELWLRRIPAGTFTMGSPEDEPGRWDDETQHEVTITQDFYIGVFECTQRQWELVMGSQPSCFNNAEYYATRPVEEVSYDMIRGTSAQAGAGWPVYGHAVDSNSFMGRIQAKTGLVFDLPTEAQWEYVCRKKADGSCWTTALNSGKSLTDEGECPNMAEVGRYLETGGNGYGPGCDTTAGTAKVGSYLPSELGLYDMHGNVREWCLDWYGAYGLAVSEDPSGAGTGRQRVLRGGSWMDDAGACRAARRYVSRPSDALYSSDGFRIAVHDVPEDCMPDGADAQEDASPSEPAETQDLLPTLLVDMSMYPDSLTRLSGGTLALELPGSMWIEMTFSPLQYTLCCWTRRKVIPAQTAEYAWNLLRESDPAEFGPDSLQRRFLEFTLDLPKGFLLHEGGEL